MATDDEIEGAKGKFPQLAQYAFSNAYRNALDSGQSVLVSDNGFLVEVFPNGTRNIIRQIDPPIPVIVGSKLTIM